MGAAARARLGTARLGATRLGTAPKAGTAAATAPAPMGLHVASRSPALRMAMVGAPVASPQSIKR